MPFLLYCICEAAAQVAPPGIGVRGEAVRELVHDGLRCFYSEVGDVGGDAAAVQKDALDFHRVTHDIFRSAAIIPFRFPTLVTDTAEATAFLASQASEYREALTRLRDAVQMEVRITLANAAAATEILPSGAAYLRARIELLAKLGLAASHAAALGGAVKWQQRQWRRDGVRCYALVRRSEVYNFEQAFRQLPVDPELNVIVSGPWPATEFLNEKLRVVSFE